MSINNIRTKFTHLGKAIYYSGSKGWNNQYTEKKTEDSMDWVGVYKYLCDIREQTDSFSTVDDKVDYLYLLSCLHTKLVATVQQVHQVYTGYYLKEPYPSEGNASRHKDHLVDYKQKADALLFKVGNLYNRIKVLRKILIDKGYDAPSLPKDTLRKIKTVFQQYPTSFVDLD